MKTQTKREYKVTPKTDNNKEDVEHPPPDTMMTPHQTPWWPPTRHHDDHEDVEHGFGGVVHNVSEGCKGLGRDQFRVRICNVNTVQGRRKEFILLGWIDRESTFHENCELKPKYEQL